MGNRFHFGSAAYRALAARKKVQIPAPHAVSWFHTGWLRIMFGAQGGSTVVQTHNASPMEVPMQPARHSLLRYAALATLLGVVSLTLSQCTMVGDKLTGVDVFRGRPTTCIKLCNDDAVLAFDAEQKEHAEQKELCDAVNCALLPQPDQAACIDARQACQQAESARHEAAKAAITQAKVDCQNGCAHTQGTGSAG